MPTTVFDQFTRRTADVTAQLTTLGIPLTAPAPPPADADPTDPWASSYAVPIDRSTLAWCTAVQMLADHHDTGIDRQVLAADALLREFGVRGLAQLHSDLHHGAPVDYRFTRCPYCSGIGEDPTQPDCQDVGCAPWHEFAGHDHLCPVCHGDDHQPQWVAEEHMTELEELLADAIEESAERASLRYRIRIAAAPPDGAHVTTRHRRCGHGTGPLHPGDQRAVAEFTAMLATRQRPAPWTGRGDVAVRRRCQLGWGVSGLG